MTELKTQPNGASVDDYINSISDDGRREDCKKLINIMQKFTGEPPKMWGSSIVGFGSYHYKYASGREGDWFLVGFSPRAQNLTLYIMSGFDGYETLLGKLGKHTTGKSCLYVKKLKDVDMDVLKDLVRQSVAHMEKINPTNWPAVAQT